jgi:hypothetical protein
MITDLLFQNIFRQVPYDWYPPLEKLMNLPDYRLLLYRKQYLLTPGPVHCPFVHKIHALSGSYLLYTHQELNVTEYAGEGFRMILLGDMFDYESDFKDNANILKRIADTDFDIVVARTGRYTGRFVLLYITGEGCWSVMMPPRQ